jgi:hypothetical protein
MLTVRIPHLGPAPRSCTHIPRAYEDGLGAIRDGVCRSGLCSWRCLPAFFRSGESEREIPVGGGAVAGAALLRGTLRGVASATGRDCRDSMRAAIAVAGRCRMWSGR